VQDIGREGKRSGAVCETFSEELTEMKNSVSNYDYESHHSIAHSPESVPSVEVHFFK